MRKLAVGIAVIALVVIGTMFWVQDTPNGNVLGMWACWAGALGLAGAFLPEDWPRA